MNDRSLEVYQRAAQDLLAVPEAFDRLRLHVISNSMWPLLRPGDAVLVQPIDPAALHVGDVIVVRRGAELITHRVIGRDAAGWHTCGDNAIFVDAPLMAEEIVGRVEAIERGDRTTHSNPISNRRLGRIAWLHWRLARRLRLERPGSNRVAIGLTWGLAAPFRLLTRWLQRMD